MTISVFPPAAGGGIKSVQRGLAGSAGTVTITAVDINKSFVNIYGTASSGTVAATGSVSGATGTLGGSLPQNITVAYAQGGGPNTTNQRANIAAGSALANISGNASLNAQNISGGTNNLVAAIVQGYLSGSTSLVVSGACRWEVVEFA